MLRTALGSLLLVSCLIAVSACATVTSSSSSASPSFTDTSRCEGSGAFWHANLGVCEKI